MGRINGRASKEEEIALRALDSGKKPKKKKFFQQKPKKLHTEKLSDEQLKEFFTRPYVCDDTFSLPPPPVRKSSTAKKSFHDFPVRDMALNNLLLIGFDSVETANLNAKAAFFLTDLRAAARALQRSAQFANGHNVPDQGDDQDDESFGYGLDMRHAHGPSALHFCNRSKKWRSGLKERYEAGSTQPSALGEPWNHGKVVLKKTKQGRRYLRRVGQVVFDEGGKMSYVDVKGEGHAYETVVRSARGTPKLPKITYPADPKELALAGSTDATVTKVDEVTETAARKPASNFDPVSRAICDENERNAAHALLDSLGTRLSPRMYDALIAAAEGSTLDEIGRMFMPGLKPSDKRPGTLGKQIIVDALEVLLLSNPAWLVHQQQEAA